MLEGEKVCLDCSHQQKDHRWSTDGFCMVDGCTCANLRTELGPLDEDLAKVILNLEKHFGRLPTDREVYRFIFGTKRERERIYQEKGMPNGWT